MPESHSPAPIRVAILISGRGSNMEALIKAAQSEGSPAQIVCVISNRPDVGGLERAKRLGVETITIDHKAYKTREAFEQQLDKTLKLYQAQLVCCAGFMRILTPWFVKRWEGQHINIHPSLLPKYKGLNTHQRAIDAKDTHAGCTVHYITPELDSGDIIDQVRVPIYKNDDAESLAKRIIPHEHALYSKALIKLCTELQTPPNKTP